MSKHFDLHCVTCDTGAGFWWNWGERELDAIWRERRWLRDFAPVLVRLGERGVDIELRIDSGPDEQPYGSALAAWIAEHTDHDVRVKSEYGDYFGDCSEWVMCDCGDRKPCRRPKGHEDDCNRKADAPA